MISNPGTLRQYEEHKLCRETYLLNNFKLGIFSKSTILEMCCLSTNWIIQSKSRALGKKIKLEQFNNTLHRKYDKISK